MPESPISKPLFVPHSLLRLPSLLKYLFAGSRSLFPVPYSLLLFLLVPALLSAQERHSFRIGKLKYQGGGDWYANPTSVPNLLDFVRKNTTVQVAPMEDIVEPGGTQIFQYPFVYATGHGNISFTDAEAANFRKYLISGGFFHADDNYGMDQHLRREMKKVFPELEWVELPFSHKIYHQQFEFPQGLPKIHEHDGNPAQGLGLIHEGRLVCFYSFECDLGDGWEDRAVHNDPEELRQKALQMGTNILLFALGN